MTTPYCKPDTTQPETIDIVIPWDDLPAKTSRRTVEALCYLAAGMSSLTAAQAYNSTHADDPMTPEAIRLHKSRHRKAYEIIKAHYNRLVKIPMLQEAGHLARVRILETLRQFPPTKLADGYVYNNIAASIDKMEHDAIHGLDKIDTAKAKELRDITHELDILRKKAHHPAHQQLTTDTEANATT